MLSFLTNALIHFFSQGLGNVLFELGSERFNSVSSLRSDVRCLSVYSAPRTFFEHKSNLRSGKLFERGWSRRNSRQAHLWVGTLEWARSINTWNLFSSARLQMWTNAAVTAAVRINFVTITREATSASVPSRATPSSKPNAQVRVIDTAEIRIWRHFLWSAFVDMDA